MLPNNRNARELIKRTILFFVLLSIAIAVCVGWVVQLNIFSSGDFWIYGNKGKIFILLAILFPFVIRTKTSLIPKVTWNTSYALYGVGLIVSLIGFFLSVGKLATVFPSKPALYYIPSHGFLMAVPVFLSLFLFGPRFLVKFVNAFKKEISLLFGIGVMLYFVTGWVWDLWPYLSGTVLQAVAAIFSLFFQTHVSPPDILIVQTFRVRVGEECSGLESLFMFSALYALIGYFESKSLNLKKFILAYIPLAIGLYIVNIFRVFLLILIGVLWSQDLAIHLFHTYLGMVLFIIYFFLFLKFVYHRLKK